MFLSFLWNAAPNKTSSASESASARLVPHLLINMDLAYTEYGHVMMFAQDNLLTQHKSTQQLYVGVFANILS